MPVKKIVKENKEEIREESAFTVVDIPKSHISSELKKRKMRTLAGISLTIIVIFLTGLNYFLNYQKNQNLQKNPVLASEVEQEAIVSKISKLIELPTTEQPTIATISDITKLKGQPFFQNAKNGDIVLIYSKTNEAILYDPTVNKILLIAPINNSQQAVAGASTSAGSGQSVSVSQESSLVNVALYNGTTIDGLTRKVQAQLTQEMPSVTVVQNANASKQNYTQTLVIDLTGKQSAAAQHLATLLQGTVGPMPSDETVPVNADILVILGTK